MKREIKVGMLVELKSGGPPMTIMNCTEYNRSGVTQIRCCWMGGKSKTKLYYGDFFIECLEILDGKNAT